MRVFAGGIPFSLATPRKTLPLLAYLLLHRDAVLARDFLSYLLWPDDTEESARTKLRATLYDLQGVLPPALDGHWVVLEGTNVRWNTDAEVTVDVEDFERALAQPNGAQDAVALYSGDLLEGLYDEWIIPPRERLRSTYLGALAQVVSHARRRLDFPCAITHAKRLLEMDSLREDVARRLIALKYEAGDRAGALEEYDRFERRVRDELGIELMAETVALREAILRDEAVAAEGSAVAPEPRHTAPRRSALPFVGRHEEMEQLLDGWSRASRGSGGLVFIGGDPGIGKSRLVMEFAREVDERGGRVLIGATGSPETIPYQAIVEALRGVLPLVASLKMDSVWLSTLATLLPELSTRVPGLPPLVSIEPQQERARLFGALSRAVLALAQPRPLLLVLEDLHWAGEGTIEALAFLSRRLALSRVFVVATYRDDETRERHPLRRAKNDATIAGTARSRYLGPLSVADVAALIESLLSPVRSSPAALHTATEGNPLLLGQLLEEPETLQLDGPSSVPTVVAGKVKRLSDEARTVAEVAALVGSRFSREVVRAVGGWEESTFSEALDELIDRRIVREATGRGAFDYAFAHQTVRDVIAEEAPPERSADRHRRIAKALETLHPQRVTEFAAELALHYERAGDAASAARHYLTAARRALSVAALAEAGAYIERGLSLTRDQRVRADFLVERDQLSRRIGDHATLKANLEELLTLAEGIGEEDFRRRVALMWVEFAILKDDKGEIDKALAALRQLLAHAGPRWEGILAFEEARAAYAHGDLDAVRTHATAALSAAQVAGDAATSAKALIRLADVAVNRAQLDEAQKFLSQAQVTAAQGGEGGVEIDSLRAAFTVAYSMADFEGAIVLAERWLERGTALGDRYAEANGRYRVGIVLVEAHREFVRAREEFSRALTIFEELDYKRGIAAILLNSGVLYDELGDWASAIGGTERALELFEALGDNRGKVGSLANLAELCAVSGDIERARAFGTAALNTARAAKLPIQEARAIDNLALVAAASGDMTQALRLAKEGLALHQASQSDQWSGRILGPLAEWHAISGDLDAARRYVEQMLAPSMLVAVERPEYHWTAAQVFRACGEERLAKKELTYARNLVAKIAAELSGEDLERYEAVPWNRAIIDAHDFDKWPSPNRFQREAE
ncbi:MAG: AAA family ATPase [Candidatus Eremiobacteraeota bacterium]|nr:AAA family ATPase [Candidatus Eremiobacteraeota bacterium]